MGRYLLGRLGQAAIVVALVSFGIFMLIRSVPGGPELILFPEMSLEQARAARRGLGLEESPLVQYARWVGDILRGQLGTSYIYSMPVTELLKSRLGATLLLVGTSFIASVTLSLVLGVGAALRRGRLLDRAVNVVSSFGLAAPVFWLGMLFIIVFAVVLQWLPPGGLPSSASPVELVRHMLLPGLVLTLLSFAELVRYVRSAVIAQLEAAYVATANAKGLPPITVVSRHILRNALVPVVTVIGLQLRALVSGAAITETVFAWPGMGRLVFDAAFNRDYPVMMGATLVVSVVVVALNLIADLSYAYLDPRIRYA